MAHWARGVQDELTRGNLLDLAKGNISAISIQSFVDEATAGAIGQAYGGLMHGRYKDVVPPISKCGPTVFEHKFADRELYFMEARATNELFSSALKGILLPLRLFQRNLLEQCGWSSKLATDRVFGDYFAGTLRSIEEGTALHIDFAPYESPSWEMICSVDSQLSANVYIDSDLETGDLLIYDKAWTLEDERYRFKDRFGYDDAAVEARSRIAVKPALGAIVLFNSRFFHRVEATWHRRLTYSFFFAIYGDHIIMWS